MATAQHSPSIAERLTTPPATAAPTPVRVKGRLARLVLAAFVLGNGAIHWYQNTERGFERIDTIGTLFWVNVVVAAVLALYLVLRRDVLGPALAVVFSTGTALAYVLARTTGLFGHQAVSPATAPATVAFVVEVAAALLGAFIIGCEELVNERTAPVVDAELHV